MTIAITPAALSRSAGVAAILAGLTFIGIQIGHPHLDVTSVGTVEWTVRNSAKAVFAALALAGVTGVYLRQVRQVGVLGLIAYLLLSSGYLLILGTSLIAGSVLPSLADTDPAYVDAVLAAAAGAMPASDIGRLHPILLVEGFAYLAGGLLFGIALFRARVLARWAAVLLAVGAVLSVALPLLSDSAYRLLAYPHAVALIGLGYSLWSSHRSVASGDALRALVQGAGHHPVDAR
jgi:hypothetical protein